MYINILSYQIVSPFSYQGNEPPWYFGVTLSQTCAFSSDVGNFVTLQEKFFDKPS